MSDEQAGKLGLEMAMHQVERITVSELIALQHRSPCIIMYLTKGLQYFLHLRFWSCSYHILGKSGECAS